MLEKSEYVSEMEHTILYKKFTRKTENDKWQQDSTYGFYLQPKPAKIFTSKDSLENIYKVHY
jgi:hypothetical protein